MYRVRVVSCVISATGAGAAYSNRSGSGTSRERSPSGKERRLISRIGGRMQ